MRAVFRGESNGICLATAQRIAAAGAIWHFLTNTFVTGTVVHVDGCHRLAAP
jgi:hypothetical protein